MSKAADPAPAKKTSLFGGKKDRLNPLLRKPSQTRDKPAAETNLTSGTGAFGGGTVGSGNGGGLLGGPSQTSEPLNFSN